MFYWEFFDVSKFLGIVFNAICSHVQSERSSDNVFVSKVVPQTFVSYRVRRTKDYFLFGTWSELILVLLVFVGRSGYDVRCSVLSHSTAPQRMAPKVRGYEPNDLQLCKTLYETIPTEIWAVFQSTTHAVFYAPAGPTVDQTNRTMAQNGQFSHLLQQPWCEQTWEGGYSLDQFFTGNKNMPSSQKWFFGGYTPNQGYGRERLVRFTSTVHLWSFIYDKY